jgi:tripartite ATP-independent transporter DctM subunit
MLSVVNMIWAKKFDLQLEPKLPATEKRKQIASRTWVALPSLLMPVIILGGIYGGVFTPTEAAAVSAVYAIVIGIAIHKELSWKGLFHTSLEAVTSIGAIMTMILFTLMLSQTYVMAHVPQTLVKLFFGFTDNKTLILIIINLFLFLVGMIVNDATGMLLVAPLLLPLVRELGVDPIHFAAIMGVNLAMGGVTPPYASILYLGMRVGKAQFNEILKPTLVFLLFGYVPVVFLTSFWPDLALFLPRLFGFVN